MPDKTADKLHNRGNEIAQRMQHQGQGHSDDAANARGEGPASGGQQAQDSQNMLQLGTDPAAWAKTFHALILKNPEIIKDDDVLRMWFDAALKVGNQEGRKQLNAEHQQTHTEPKTEAA